MMVSMFSMLLMSMYFAISVLGVYALVLGIKALKIYIDKNEHRF